MQIQASGLPPLNCQVLFGNLATNCDNYSSFIGVDTFHRLLVNLSFMKIIQKTLYTVLVLLLMGGMFTACGSSDHHHATPHTHSTPGGDSLITELPADSTQLGPEYTSNYICTMHCEGSGSDKPGKCPVCGMTYVWNSNNGPVPQSEEN